MIDLETMGQGKQAAFVQVAAVKFNPFGAPLPEMAAGQVPLVPSTTFYRNVSLDSAVRLGLKMDVSTVEWWLKRDASSLFDPEPQPIQKVMADLKKFVNWKEDFVWSKGPGFDCAILSEAYRMAGDKWGLCNFAHERCVRTVIDWSKIPADMEQSGVTHNALDDAWHQARLVQEAARRFGLNVFDEVAK